MGIAKSIIVLVLVAILVVVVAAAGLLAVVTGRALPQETGTAQVPGP